ncbi:MAG TPA: RpiB/LacA/LacB family sugar-phosphate isomerase, partial [Bacillota bacterium]|nr:RpiB/LacA/LacB family sugar-phosphate isomerase [Bacillota bacterium]
LVCGTGVGMAIAANKYRGIRAALCSDTFTARCSREHNDANILALGARVIGSGLALEIVDIFLNTAFQGGRHQRRVEKIALAERRA